MLFENTTSTCPMKQTKPRKRMDARRSTDVDVHVGQRLRMRRTVLGISQEQLAANLGLTFQQVQKYENGSNRVSVSRLFQLGKILDVPISWFFEELSAAAAKSVLGERVLVSDTGDEIESLFGRRETLEFVRVYTAIKNPAIRRKLRSMAEALADSP